MEIAVNAQVFDLAGDYSSVTNPNGVWAYNKGADPLPRVDDWLGMGPAWAHEGTRIPGHIPVVYKDSATTVFIHAWDSANGLAYGAANVTWTSPSDGLADVSGFGFNVDFENRGGIWSIAVDGTDVTSGELYTGDAFDFVHPFDFANGSGGSAALSDIPVTMGTIVRLQWVSTSPAGAFFSGNLSINVTPVPEPAGCGIAVAIAMVGLAGVYRLSAKQASRGISAHR